MPSWMALAAMAGVGVVVFVEILIEAPLLQALVLVGVTGAMALPGVVLVAASLGSTGPARITAWFVGPALGLGLSALVMFLGARASLPVWLGLVLAPALAVGVTLVGRRRGGLVLRLPMLGRHDAIALACALLAVPIVNFASYDSAARLGSDLDAAHSFPQILSRSIYGVVASWGIAAPEILLVSGLAFGLTFVAFFYWIARAAGGSPTACVLAVLAGLLANERLLLVQPHQLTGYVFGVSALWLVGLSLEVANIAVSLSSGILVTLALLFSGSDAFVMAVSVAALYAVRLVQQRQWRSAISCVVVGLAPLVLVSVMALPDGMMDEWLAGSNERWKVIATIALVPLTFCGLARTMPVRWVEREGTAPTLLVLSALAFHYLLDVRAVDVYEVWRRDYLLLISCVVIGAVMMTAAWQTRQKRSAPLRNVGDDAFKISLNSATR